MSQWEGQDGLYHINGCPHITKMPRKPVSVGVEFKGLSDADTRMILKLEINKGKTENDKKEHAKQGWGTGVTLRLTKSYYNTWRTVIGDSAFASVKTLSNLFSNGLLFVGMVKTASTKYPINYLSNYLKSCEPGTSRMLSATIPGTNNELMYAIGWKHSNISTVIANAGLTTDGSPYINSYTHLVENNNVIEEEHVSEEITRPQMVSLYYENYNAIDINDHLRQDSLALEEVWGTTKWYIRLFTTILGITFTDSYFGWKYEKFTLSGVQNANELKFNSFLDTLAYELIYNEYITEGRELRSQDTDVSYYYLFCFFSRTLYKQDLFIHELKLLREHAYYTSKEKQLDRCRRNCSVCNTQTSYYCALCSSVDIDGKIYAVCRPVRNGKSCLDGHREKLLQG